MTVTSPSAADLGDLLSKIATGLDRIATALEAPRAGPALASSHTAKLAAPVAGTLAEIAPSPLVHTTEPAAAADAPALTIDGVRRELIAATSAGVQAAVILAGIGAKRLSDVAPENYPALVAAARAAVQGAKS